MPDWITVSGVVTNIATVFDLSYRYAPHQQITGKDAATLLKEAKQILRDAGEVLEDHKDVLPRHQYEQFKLEYRSYNWQITDESQEHRAVRDALVKQSRILSQLYANKGSHQNRAYTLLQDVESFQTDVLSASRKATPIEVPFPDEQPSWESQQTSDQSQTSFTSWFSIFGKTSPNTPSDHESEPSSALTAPPSNAPDIIAEGQGFIVAVTHFPEAEALEDAGSGQVAKVGSPETMYRRMISFESAGKRIDIIDPKSHSLDPRNNAPSEETMRAMTRLGERLMAEQHPKIPEGSQITNNTSESSSMESAIQKFRQQSAG